ncbi:MAG: ABC transporter permease [Dehalococcoidales bacterium]|nr:ABC transporter permease [Dehalococcoidales bacterium]
MNFRIVKALLKKDFSLFMSNRFYMLITFVGIIFFIAIYFLMPSQVDEELNVAMYAEEVPVVFAQLSETEGINIEYFEDEETLKQEVLDGNYQAGISLPEDIMETWQSGGIPDIKVYYSSSTATEIKDAIVTIVEELSYLQTGQSINYNISQEVLGHDMAGEQLSLRERMRPLLAVVILLMEILTLASLISVEIEQGTARALFVTPMRTADLFMAKGILGVGLALAQAILFMLLAGGFANQPLIILITLLLGSLMVVGISFLLASVARDVMAVTSWGMLILIILMIPGFGTTVPGILSEWTKVIPSFYLTDTVNRVANYGANWGDVGINMAVLAGITVLAIYAGMNALRRRYR